MKLYIHDEKHDQIIADMDIGPLTDDQMKLLNRVISFLDEKEITGRYKRLVLAENHSVLYNDGEPEVEFSWGKDHE